METINCQIEREYSRDYAHIRKHQPENNYLFINKIQNTSRPTVRGIGKIDTSIANSAGNEEKIYEEIPDKKGFKCSRCSLLVSILQFGIIVVCMALLSIYIYKMEMLQKEILLLNPLVGRCAGVNYDLCELLTFKELNEAENISCSVQFVLQEIPHEDLKEPNYSHQIIKGWSKRSKKYKSNQLCIEPNSNYSHFAVNEKGTYFFISQLSFFADDELLKKEFKKHLFVGQKVLSNDYQLMQQSSLVSVPQLEEGQPMPGCGENRGSLHVSTLSGIIALEAREIMSIYATPVNWLCRQNDASFFGVYRIG